MMQIARNVTMEEWGFLSTGQYLIHDRDGKYCPAFQQIIDAAGVERVPLPPRSPNLNAYAERWVRSVKEECLVADDSVWGSVAPPCAERSMWSIFITSGIIRARAMCCSFLRSAKTQSVKVPFSVVNGSGGC